MITHPETKTCNRCGELKKRSLDFFRSAISNSDRLSGRCRSCDSVRGKQWYAANREKALARAKLWAKEHPDRLREYREARREGVPTRGAYKIQAAVDQQKRREMEKARRRRSVAERVMRRVEKRTVEALGGRPEPIRKLIGCTPTALKAYLESRFVSGMTWDNRGSEWHVDHIQPFRSFDLSDPEQRRAACHYTNLQPVWLSDHKSKTSAERRSDPHGAFAAAMRRSTMLA